MNQAKIDLTLVEVNQATPLGKQDQLQFKVLLVRLKYSIFDIQYLSKKLLGIAKFSSSNQSQLHPKVINSITSQPQLHPNM